MTSQLPKNPVFGFAELAKMLGTTPGALWQAKHKKRLGIEPVCYIGRTAVFDGDEVEALALERRNK